MEMSYFGSYKDISSPQICLVAVFISSSLLLDQTARVISVAPPIRRGIAPRAAVVLLVPRTFSESGRVSKGRDGFPCSQSILLSE